MKKYKLAQAEELPGGQKVYRIQALRDIPRHDVRSGEFGGLVSSEDNLSQFGDAWIDDNAMVLGDKALVEDDAYVGENASVLGSSRISSNALVQGNSRLDDATLSGKNIWISNGSRLTRVKIAGNNITIGGNAILRDVEFTDTCKGVTMGENARILFVKAGNTVITGKNILLSGEATLKNVNILSGIGLSFLDQAYLADGVSILGNQVTISEQASIYGVISMGGNVTIRELASLYQDGDSYPIISDLDLSGDVALSTETYVKTIAKKQ